MFLGKLSLLAALIAPLVGSADVYTLRHREALYSRKPNFKNRREASFQRGLQRHVRRVEEYNPCTGGKAGKRYVDGTGKSGAKGGRRRVEDSHCNDDMFLEQTYPPIGKSGSGGGSSDGVGSNSGKGNTISTPVVPAAPIVVDDPDDVDDNVGNVPTAFPTPLFNIDDDIALAEPIAPLTGPDDIDGNSTVVGGATIDVDDDFSISNEAIGVPSFPDDDLNLSNDPITSVPVDDDFSISNEGLATSSSSSGNDDEVLSNDPF